MGSPRSSACGSKVGTWVDHRGTVRKLKAIPTGAEAGWIFASIVAPLLTFVLEMPSSEEEFLKPQLFRWKAEAKKTSPPRNEGLVGCSPISGSSRRVY